MLPVLLLHGALGSKSQLHPLKFALRSAGLEVYSMNFSGHNGEAFCENFGIEAFAVDVETFLTNNQLRKAHIFGYSMGGYVALWCASRQPDKVGKVVTLGTKFDWSPESAKAETKKLDPEKIIEKVPAFARILEHRHAPNNWKDLLNKTSGMMLELGDQPLLTDEILASITHETLVLLGDQDDMADRIYSEHVASKLPNRRFCH